MTSLVEKLKARTLELRKARSPLAPTFQMVMADALSQAKVKGLVDFNEEMAAQAINRGINGAKETLSQAPGDALTIEKIEALTAVLPVPATEDAVRAEAMQWWTGVVTEAMPRTYVGEMMKHLMTTFGASLNRKMASDIAKEILG